MKKLLSLIAAILLTGIVFAGPKHTSSCVEGWSWIGDKHGTCVNTVYSVYSNPNACNLYLAVDYNGNCYDVKRDSEGYYYILTFGKWCELQ